LSGLTAAGSPYYYWLSISVNGCASDTVLTEVEVFENPTVTPTNNGPLCAYDTLQLIANPALGSSPFTYVWSGPGGFGSIQENPMITSPSGVHSGTYYVTITSADGCTGNGTTQVLISPKPTTPMVTASDVDLCSNDSLVLMTAPYNGSSVTYEWTDPNGTVTTTTVPTITYTTPLPGTYQLVVTVDGCSSLPSAPLFITIVSSPTASVVDSRVNKRNESRYENNIKHGKNYDSKNMMHTFRLLDMAIEILRDGKLNVKRQNREELLKIRNGEWEYDALIELANEKMKQVEQAYSVSNLQEEPNKIKMENLLVEMRNELYK